MGFPNTHSAIHARISPFGTTYYLDGTNGASSNSGKSPDAAVSTLAEASTVSSAGDTIVIAPGTYTVDVASASLAPTTDQTWMAAVPSYGGTPNVIITADADDHVNAPVAIDVDNVTFRDIEFLLVAGGTNALYLMDISQTTAVSGGACIDCRFNLNDVNGALLGVRMNDATNATTGFVFNGCTFSGGLSTTSSSYIQIGVGGALGCIVEHSSFELKAAGADCYGVHFLDNAAAANKSYATVIRHNDFFGPLDAGADGVGVFIGGITELEILAMVHSNHFAFCAATAVTIDKMNKGVTHNYVGDDATGILPVDPGT